MDGRSREYLRQPASEVLPLVDVRPALKHPAKFTDTLWPVFVEMLRGRRRVLDPFAGTGTIFTIERLLPGCRAEGVELEPEWAALHPRTTHGNALALPWPDRYFDAVLTSPAYGNRMADTLLRDRWKRSTYASELGRELSPDSGAALQWGPRYREFHVKAWTEARRVLRPGGAFVLNIKDHIRAGVLQHVTDWHVEALGGLGFRLLRHERINTPSMRYGANADKRVEFESVILFELEG